MPDWRSLHQAVLQNTDAVALEKLIFALEAAIFVRFQELAHRQGRLAERAHLRTAAADVIAIKIEKLGWPDPRKFIASRKINATPSRLK